MADGVFNIAKGAAAEMFRDAAANGIVLLLTVNQAEVTLIDHDDLGAMLAAANTEAVFTNYARKTGLTGTITVDDPNDRVDIDFPDQTWSSAGNGANETLTKLITAYENAAADATRIPLTHHDFALTTDGSDVTAQLNAAGFYRAA
ncbi:hypothetical protein LCGC14_1243860 [marine sediment metagenome]|uniref:Uncharacterized protein n=1 Tax=marine sediment metagenome TaxID=412755 RepID=A0A0F9LS75_9ZZZZ